VTPALHRRLWLGPVRLSVQLARTGPRRLAATRACPVRRAP
jgi:hypothetical protein